MMNDLGCVTGRFQPVHRQHMELLDIALQRCAHLVVAVTNPDPGTRRAEATSAHRHTTDANPFTFYERVRLLSAALSAPLRAGRVTIVPFDLTAPQFWTQYVPRAAHQFVRAYSNWERDKAARFEQAGYRVTVIDGDPTAKLCATDIRRSMRSGDPRWRRQVPQATAVLLDDMLADMPLRDRL